MAFLPTSPITGATVAGLTLPTYTVATDTPPGINAKQFAVTALGGTQTGVDVHSVSKPFTITMFRPSLLRMLPAVNPLTGTLKNIPVNTYKVITRKGAMPAANQIPAGCRVTTMIEVPAGVDTFEPEEVRAMLSAHIGCLSQQSDGITSTVLTGVL